MLTDTISSVGWWLVDTEGARLVVPSSQCCVSDKPVHNCSIPVVPVLAVVGHTHNPEAVLAWVREGKLP